MNSRIILPQMEKELSSNSAALESVLQKVPMRLVSLAVFVCMSYDANIQSSLHTAVNVKINIRD